MSYVSYFISFDLLIIKNRFDGQMVKSAHSTHHRHHNILHLASYLGQPLTTGSWQDGHFSLITSHAKTEIMNRETHEWNTVADYPFNSV